MRIGIKSKIIACIIIGTAITTISAILLVHKILFKGFSAQIMETGGIVAQYLGKKAAAYALTDESLQFDLIIYQIMQENPDILYIFVDDKNEKIITSTIPFDYAYQIAQYTHKTPNANKQIFHFYLDDDIIKGGVYHLSQNILKSHLGTIHIGFSDKTFTAASDNFDKFFILMIVLICLITVFISSTIIKNFTLPLENLLADIEKIQQGKLESVTVNFPENEIGLLGNGLNQMIKHLQDHKNLPIGSFDK